MLPDGAPHDLVGSVHSGLLERDPSLVTDARRVAALVRGDHPLLPEASVHQLATAVAARANGLGALDALLTDPTITDVMVHGHGEVWIERAGQLEHLDLSLSRGEIDRLVERILAPLGLRVDRTAPVADARLPDGSRVNVVVPPLAVDGPCLTIRRFGVHAIPLTALCSPGVAAMLSWAVQARLGIVVSGGTGAGKTTLLNALAGSVPDGERIVTVEDTAELRLAHHHVVRLEARPATADGLGATAIRDLVRNALRMRPDRIIVGEVRGPEAVDMLWAMSTGHDGSLSTCHASSPADALRRLEMMVLAAGLDLPLAAVSDQIRAAVDLVVQVARGPIGERKIVTVVEVPTERADDGSLRTLADRTGLVALPQRQPRTPDAPPLDPQWIER